MAKSKVSSPLDLLAGSRAWRRGSGAGPYAGEEDGEFQLRPGGGPGRKVAWVLPVPGQPACQHVDAALTNGQLELLEFAASASVDSGRSCQPSPTAQCSVAAGVPGHRVTYRDGSFNWRHATVQSHGAQAQGWCSRRGGFSGPVPETRSRLTRRWLSTMLVGDQVQDPHTSPSCRSAWCLAAAPGLPQPAHKSEPMPGGN